MYQLIYADPPWQFKNTRTGGSMVSGAAHHYPTLSPAQIADLPVASLAAPASVCGLWVPSALLPSGLAVLEAWGFQYRTSIYWHKTGRKGMGFWLRNEVEQCLIGVRGKVKPWRATFSNHLTVPWAGHSVKPREVQALLTELVPGLRLELFARRGVAGWVCAGLDLGWDLLDEQTYVRLAVVGREAACAREQSGTTRGESGGDTSHEALE